MGGRDPRPDQAVRRERRGRQRRAARAARVRVRLPRAERCRQDHSHSHAARPDAGQRRHDVAARDPGPGRPQPGAGQGRRDRRRAPLPPPPHRPGEPAPAGRRARRCRGRADPGVAEQGWAHRARRRQGGLVLDGHAPAPGGGGMPAQRPRAADPGRADERPRPGGNARDAHDDPRAGQRGAHADALVAPTGRGRAHLRRGRWRGSQRASRSSFPWLPWRSPCCAW